MAKKVRKPRSASPRTYSESSGTSSAPAAPASTSTSKGAAPAKGANSPKVVDLRAEYQVVGGDLKRLLLTSAVMFAILLGVNFAVTLLR